MFQGEDDRGAGGPSAGAELTFSEQMKDVFAKDVFGPMYDRARSDPTEVLSLVDDLKKRLSAFETVLVTLREAAPPVRPTGPRADAPKVAAEADDGDSAPGLDDYGRNQLSKVRELIVLGLLDSSSRSFSLNEIMAELDAHGLTPTRSAVVSQLHRLKSQDLVNVSGSGTYSLKDDNALGYLKSLRREFEGMKPKRRT